MIDQAIHGGLVTILGAALDGSRGPDHWRAIRAASDAIKARVRLLDLGLTSATMEIQRLRQDLDRSRAMLAQADDRLDEFGRRIRAAQLSLQGARVEFVGQDASPAPA